MVPPRLRRLLAAGMAALLLAACGGAEQADDPTTAPAPAEAAEPTEAAVQAEGAVAEDQAPDEVTVAHAQGETTVPVDPETVVVFDLGSLETLHELGIEVTGVPQVTTWPESLAHYADDAHPKVGTLFEPDYEQVNALEPDLIIVAGRSSAVYPELSEIAPTVDLTVDNADFLASFAERAEALASIFGAGDALDARLAAIEEDAARVRGQAGDAGTGLVVLTTGGKVSAYGPGSRFGIIHDALGVTPAVPDLEPSTHGDAISFEFILEANPDRLYVLDRDAATGDGGEAAEQVLDNELVRETTAWRNGDVFYLDPIAWYLTPNGLSSVESMVAEIEASLG